MRGMNRRRLLQLAGTGVAHAMMVGSTALSATTRHRISCAVRSDQLPQYLSELVSLPAIEIEDWLDPTFPERISCCTRRATGASRLSWANPALWPVYRSQPRFVREAHSKGNEATFRRVLQVRRRHRRARDYLSLFLPPDHQPIFLRQGWLTQSVAFWRSYLNGVDPQMTVSLCNTFEYHPNLMLKTAEEVGRPNFRLAFDLGHFLVYARESLADWLRPTASRISSVYVHSNDGKVDTHDELGRGALTCEHVNQVAAALGPDANLVLKLSNKESIGRSMAWLATCGLQS